MQPYREALPWQLTAHVLPQPKKWIRDFQKAGCDLYCFHYEAAVTSTAADNPTEHSETKTNPKEMIRFIHEQGMLAGIAIKPETSVDVLWDILDGQATEEVPDVGHTRCCNRHGLCMILIKRSRWCWS